MFGAHRSVKRRNEWKGGQRSRIRISFIAGLCGGLYTLLWPSTTSHPFGARFHPRPIVSWWYIGAKNETQILDAFLSSSFWRFSALNTDSGAYSFLIFCHFWTVLFESMWFVGLEWHWTAHATRDAGNGHEPSFFFLTRRWSSEFSIFWSFHHVLPIISLITHFIIFHINIELIHILVILWSGRNFCCFVALGTNAMVWNWCGLICR